LGTRAAIPGIIEDTADRCSQMSTEVHLREAKVTKRAEQRMDLTISTAIPADRGGTVEYETIRSLDSVLACSCDFNEMTTRHFSVDSTDRAKRQVCGAGELTWRLHGEQDDSFFPMSKPLASRWFQNPIVLVPMIAKTKINNTNIE
jgi:hypothetical protein